MSRPQSSAKGAILLLTLKAVKAAIQAGSLDRNEVEAKLGQHASLLDANIAQALWYPVEAMGICAEMLTPMLGPNREAALEEIGVMGVAMLKNEGLYAQIELAGEAMAAGSRDQVVRFGRRATTLVRSFYNFGDMDFNPVPGEDDLYRMIWCGVEPLPDALRFVTQGFIRQMVSDAMKPNVEVSSKRLTTDDILFDLRIP